MPVSASLNAGPVLTLKHSITTTDYTVRVLLSPPKNADVGRWVLKTVSRDCH